MRFLNSNLRDLREQGCYNITVLHCVIRIRGSPLRTMICSQRFWICEWSLMDLKHTRYNIILSGYFSIGASAWLPSIKQGDFTYWSPTASKGRLRSEISLSSAIGACGQGNAWQARPNETLRLGSGWVGCIYIYNYRIIHYGYYVSHILQIDIFGFAVLVTVCTFWIILPWWLFTFVQLSIISKKLLVGMLFK